MRELLWRHYSSRFRPGDRVLDVACGTGLDSLFLAQRGVSVTGIDISPGMIAQFRAKSARLGLQDRVETRVMSFACLGSWPSHSYDGIVSAFAGLNSTPDLSEFSRHAARLLRPEGRMVLHLLNSFSLWEWLGLVRDRRWSEARRLGSVPCRSFVVGKPGLQHHLFHPRQAYESFFSREFRLEGCYGLGFSPPPPHGAPVSSRRGPRSRDAGQSVGAASRPFLNWGRFFVLDLALRRDAAP